MSRAVRTRTTGIVLALVLAIASCGGSEPSRPDPDQGADVIPGGPGAVGGARATRLLLSVGEPGDGPEVPLRGRLGVDSRGCVTLGAHVVVATRGSRLGLDGRTVVLAGIGENVLGETVSAARGILDDTDPSITKVPASDRGCSGTSYAHLAADADAVAKVPAPDSLDCASGYSSGGSPDYFGIGGEATAVEAYSRAEVASRARPDAPLQVRLVESTEDRVRVGFLDPAGTVIGNATVVKVDGRWQIEGMAHCAPVGSVAAQPGP
jgi:hypothetical protein